MKVRLGLVLATAALLLGTGCASGGGPSAGPAGATLPSGEVLPPGIRPQDNEHTKSADLYLTQAQAATDPAQQQQRYQQALEEAKAGINANPENAKSYFQAAQADVGLNNFAEAATMFDKAEELYPRYVLETEPYRERGWVNAYNQAIVPMGSGNLEEAARLFEMANRLYDQRPEAYLQLGTIYSQLGEYDRSIENYQHAMDLLEESKEAQLADTATAESWQDLWSISTTGLGQALTANGDFQAAADLYGRLLQEDPNNAELIGALAGVLTELNMPDSVEVLYDQLLSRPGLSERDLFNAGVGLYQIGQYDRAAQAFRAAAEMDEFNRDARLNLALTYNAAEDWEDLVPAARQLLEVDPLNGTVWIFLTRAYSELGETEEANTVFQEYQSIGYELTEIHLNQLPEGGTEILGTLQNNSAEPGTTVTLRFHLGDENHQEAGTVDVRVQLPEVEQTTTFRGLFDSPTPVSGYWYEVIK